MAVAAVYQNLSDALSLEITELTRKVRLGAGLRLIVFVSSALAFADILGWGSGARWGIGLALLVLFLFLVRWNRRLDMQRKARIKRKEICEGELKSLAGDDSYWFDGQPYFDARHAYAGDLDLFGKHSIYRRLCRAFLKPGQHALAKRLANWSDDHNEIAKRQDAVRELSPMLDWRLDVAVEAALAGDKPPEFESLSKWGEDGNVFKLSGIFKYLHVAIPIWTAAMIALRVMGQLSDLIFSLGILAPLVVVGTHLKKTQAVNDQLGKQFKGLESVSGLFDHLAHADFQSKVLSGLKQEGEGAGSAFRALSRITNAFDNRNNLIVAVVMNILVGWDFWCLRRLEAWHANHGNQIDHWIKTLAELEATASLAAFSHNYPEAVWPTFSDGPAIVSEQLGHPLLNPKARIDNDFHLDEKGFAIITGANMAGKSTFLRTLGVNLVLAMAGAPVIATKFSFKSIPLFSSMRTTDALEEQASYFYAELRRLQEVIEILESGQKRFVILDEILKGTNSRDKAEGSRKFLEKLTKLPTTGVVATHDLSLCEITAAYPQIRNLCFDVEIGEDDLTFDYLLKDGICSNMNATFLMDKMGITR